MQNFQDLLNLCQIEAIDSTLNPSEVYLWRKMCRTFSEKFNTPISLVEKMDPEYVIRHVLENQFEKVDVKEKIDEVLKMILTIEDPNYVADEEKAVDDFVKLAEEEENQRLKEGRSIVGGKKESPEKALLKPETPKEEINPTGGSINLEYLQGLEGEED